MTRTEIYNTIGNLLYKAVQAQNTTPKLFSAIKLMRERPEELNRIENFHFLLKHLFDDYCNKTDFKTDKIQNFADIAKASDLIHKL